MRNALLLALAFLVMSPPASALTFDVFDTRDLLKPIGQVQSINENQNAVEHYDFGMGSSSTASGHPAGVPTGPNVANFWIHQDLTTGQLSFGFIFSEFGGPFNQPSIELDILNSTGPSLSLFKDDPDEADVSLVDGYFSGAFSYRDNSDGFVILGLAGPAWSVEVTAIDFGIITAWNAASGDGNHLQLSLDRLYLITPASLVSVPEPPSASLVFILGGIFVRVVMRQSRSV